MLFFTEIDFIKLSFNSTIVNIKLHNYRWNVFRENSVSKKKILELEKSKVKGDRS
jgi:hypothetical protein